jgi:hypothetical protein
MNTLKHFGKRSQFFSIMIFLFIVVLLMLFSYISSVRDKDEDFRMERLKTNVEGNFVATFESVYIPEILAAAAKPALLGYLKETDTKLGKKDLADIMEDGMIDVGPDKYLDERFMTNNMVKKVLSTLVFSNTATNSFDYFISKVEMINKDTIRMTFSVSYIVDFEGKRVWSNPDLIVPIEFDIYSLTHPVYNTMIGTDWVEDSSSCFTEDVFIDAEGCVLNHNMKPEYTSLPTP